MNVMVFVFVASTAMSSTVHSFNSFGCGIANFESSRGRRIVGGSSVFGWKYPWYGSLIATETGQINCGVNLISSKHLLTAAHCYDGYGLYGSSEGMSLETIYDVHLGLTNWCLPDRRRKIHKIKVVHIHPEYMEFAAISADIAVLELRHDAVNFRPICLPLNGEISSRGHVLGFGLTQHTFNSLVCALREIFVDIFSADECKRNANPSAYNSDDTICAGLLSGGVDACQGDSGGLLQIKNENNKHFIVGIVSYGDKCGLRNQPGIYTNVSYHLPWIRQYL